MKNKIMQYALYLLGIELLSYNVHTGDHSNIVFYTSILLVIISLIWDIVYLINKGEIHEK